MNREEFEEWFWDIYRTNGDVENFTPTKESMFIAWQEATTRQQKIIDELKVKSAAWEDKSAGLENKLLSVQAGDIWKRAKENPDVPCPACKGEKKIIMGRDITDTGWCYDNCCYCNGKGTVSTVKTLQYENEQLKSKCNNYAKRLVIEGIDDVSFLGSAIVEEKI